MIGTELDVIPTFYKVMRDKTTGKDAVTKAIKNLELNHETYQIAVMD